MGSIDYDRTLTNRYRVTLEEEMTIRDSIGRIDREIPDAGLALVSFCAILLDRGFAARSIVSALNELSGICDS